MGLLKKYLINNIIVVYVLVGTWNIYAPLIESIHSFDEVSTLLESQNKNSLIIFDVDETLTVPESKILFSENTVLKEYLLLKCQNLIQKPFDFFYKNLLLSKLLIKEKKVLIEPRISQLISSLQDKGCMVIALTAVSTGSFYVIPSLQELRFTMLHKLGIDFSKSAPDITINFDKIATPDTSPLFHKGILFSGPIEKGIILRTFLDQIPQKPDNILFFDNNYKWVQSVANEVTKYDIPFQGYHYLGVQRINKAVNFPVAFAQLHYLLKYEEWLSEKEIQELLDKQKSNAL